MEPLFTFSKPVKHVEDSITWHRLALDHPFVVEGSFSTACPQGSHSSSSSLSSTRICLLNSLLATKGIFSSVPSFAHLSQLAPPWTLLPATSGTGLSTWSPVVRWVSPSTQPSSVTLLAVWISRSLIVPELRATPLPSDLIELDGDESPECEEVEIPSSEDSVVHLKDRVALQKEARKEVRRLQQAAQEASDLADDAEAAFLRKYGEAVSDDSDSDDSD
jgi:hypothetical protein